MRLSAFKPRPSLFAIQNARASGIARRQTASMSLLRTCGTKDFEAELGKLSSGYIHFKSEWCPDCTRSNAVVREALAAAGQPLLVVDVGERPEWKTPDAPLRKDPRFRLCGIPTLVRWQGGEVAARLEKPLENAASPEAALKAVAGFVAAQE